MMPSLALQDTLDLLRNTIPERLTRFVDIYMTRLDAADAAAQVGAPGQERTLMADPRSLTYLGALCGQLRDTHAQVRSHMVGMLAHMALYDPAQALSPASGWLPFAEWPESLRMCVDSIELNDSGGIKRVKFVKRLDVISMLLDLTGGAHDKAKSKHTRVIFETEG